MILTLTSKEELGKAIPISPKLFTATLQNVMRTLEWGDMGVKINGRQIHHLRFADDIVLITPDISQAKRMLADFDQACG
uniref:Reverse transcriptase domain-containing protein n=1 Tax=Angiostrongylus cantonensis TaxID=6313 RepID=A0A0K0CUR3_ANGCA